MRKSSTKELQLVKTERMRESHHFVTLNAIINSSNNHEWLKLSEKLMGVLIMRKLGDYYTNPLTNHGLNKRNRHCGTRCDATQKTLRTVLPKRLTESK